MRDPTVKNPETRKAVADAIDVPHRHKRRQPATAQELHSTARRHLTRPGAQPTTPEFFKGIKRRSLPHLVVGRKAKP
jgi:hypothetical protein